MIEPYYQDKDTTLYCAPCEAIIPYLSKFDLLKYVNPIKGRSTEIVKKYDDNSLDFVFIDADHKYESVRADILAWMPKVKKGGILAGHDYIDCHNGVIKSVDETLSGFEIIECSTNKCWLWIK